MRSFDLSEISIFQIQLFIAAGNECNYTRAARLCHTTQPTVSRNIDALQQTLGIQLFNHSGRKIRLTPAGKQLHREFTKTLEGMTQSIQKAHALQEGYTKFFRVSFPFTEDPTKYLYPLMEDFIALPAMKGIRVRYFVDTMEQATERLVNYQTDVVFTQYFFKDIIEQKPDLEYRVAFQVPLTAYMLRTNYLSSRKTITIADLQGRRLILPHQTEIPEYYAMLMDYFKRAKVRPLIATHTTTLFEGLLNLQNDDEVVISDRAVMHYGSKEMVHVDLEDTVSGVLMVWRKNEQRTAIMKEFLDCSAKFFQNYQKYLL